MSKPKDLILVKDARKLLGVSNIKMANLIRDGYLTTYENPLDKREKLISKEQVLALKPHRAEAA